MSTKPNVLIIGGSSFVARYFIKLLNDVYSIRTVSRKTTGYENEYLSSNFFELTDELFSNVSIVVNCAAIVHQTQEPDIKVYNRINYELPLYLAEKAKRNGVKTFVQLSTIAVYGNVSHINESTTEAPVNAYGKSKLQADKALVKLMDEQFKVLIFRPPLIYGAKDAPGNMMRLIKLIQKKLPLPFKGQENRRDFIHIKNLIGFMQAGIEKNIAGIYLVSDQRPVSVTELYDLIVKHSNIPNRSFKVPSLMLKLVKTFKPGIYDKLFSGLTIDSNLTIEKLKFKPENLVESGIKEMIT